MTSTTDRAVASLYIEPADRRRETPSLHMPRFGDIRGATMVIQKRSDNDQLFRNQTSSEQANGPNSCQRLGETESNSPLEAKIARKVANKIIKSVRNGTTANF